MSDTVIMPILPVLPGISLPQSQKTIPFPVSKTITSPTKKSIPKPRSAIEEPSTQNSGKSIDLPIVNDIENELSELGYTVINKIVTQKLQFLKAINKKGQKVYIYIDISDCSVKHNEIIITETNTKSLSYSIKNGAYNCAGTDVIGIVFEYGTNSICTIMRRDNELSFNETNYVFNHKDHSHNLSFEGCVITYPIIKFSELKVNPDMVLYNTDVVTRRLRNSEDSYERQELANTDCALEKLNEALCMFKFTCNNSTENLLSTIQQLKSREDYQDYELRNDLIKSNDNIIKLICIMKKVASKRKEMEKITSEIEQLTNYLNSEI